MRQSVHKGSDLTRTGSDVLLGGQHWSGETRNVHVLVPPRPWYAGVSVLNQMQNIAWLHVSAIPVGLFYAFKNKLLSDVIALLESPLCLIQYTQEFFTYSWDWRKRLDHLQPWAVQCLIAEHESVRQLLLVSAHLMGKWWHVWHMVWSGNHLIINSLTLYGLIDALIQSWKCSHWTLWFFFALSLGVI